MRQQVGLERSAEALEAALTELAHYPTQTLPAACADHDTLTAMHAVLVARLIATGALLRQESRGAHLRRDYPHTAEVWRGHIVQQRGHAPHMVTSITDDITYSAGEPLERMLQLQAA
ncbi:MAG: hypothetical protein HC876_16565 [Chloroflexaceae bacterium]|nr:hypothetical protein [Chloroflexaceae bacterium]